MFMSPLYAWIQLWIINTSCVCAYMHLVGMKTVSVDGIQCDEADWNWFCCCVDILFFLIMFLLVLEFVDYENWLGCLAIITTEANWGKMVPWLLRSCHWRLPSLMLLKTRTRLVLLSSSVEKGSNCVESVHDTDSPLLTRGSSAR